MIIYSPVISPRLRYIADFIGSEFTGQPARLTNNQDEFILSDAARINYSNDRVTPDEVWVKPFTLLFETGIQDQQVECTDWNGHRVFFMSGGDIPFDIFAAIFYLVSRYEEYIPHQKDKYGRYGYKNALAYREGFLTVPLVNNWLMQLKVILRNKFPGSDFTEHRFTFLPTYDIDEAYSFKYKQWWRSAGAAVKDLLKGRFAQYSLRRKVLNGKETDPFDSFSWLNDLHRPYQIHPVYFFLVAGRTGKFDKNILPDQVSLQSLMRQHAERYKTGIHPSWRSGDNPELVHKEKDLLEQITKIKITASRQHYIRMTLPETYRNLIRAGITDDFSMGYGSINGFRASVCSSFYWYDLEKEQQTHLRIHPFCFMDANSFFEQKLSAVQALDEMHHYFNVVKKVNGILCTVWHNTFLGTGQLFEGWREVYTQFFHEAAKQESYHPGY